MTLEATVESTPGHRETCYVLLVPKEYKGGTVMADIEAYFEGKLAGCHLKPKVFYGRVGYRPVGNYKRRTAAAVRSWS